MKKIRIGHSYYNINYTQEAADKIMNKIIDWMEEPSHYAASCGEGIMQSDNTLINAPNLIVDIVDNILKPEFIEEI